MMKSWEYEGAGGHVGRHIGCLLGNGPMSFLVALMCSLPTKTWGKTPRSSNLS